VFLRFSRSRSETLSRKLRSFREKVLTFSKTALIDALVGQISDQDMKPNERGHFSKLDVEAVIDEGTDLDTDERSLHLASGNWISFEKLLIACA